MKKALIPGSRVKYGMTAREERSFGKLRMTRDWLFYALLFLLPFELYPRFELASSTVRLSQIVGLMLIATCIPLLWQKRGEWLQTPWVFLLAFVGISVLSSLLAMSCGRALLTTSFYAFDFVLAYIVALTFSLRKSDVYRKILLGVGVLVVAFCLLQFFGDSLGLASRYTLLLAPYTKVIFGFPRIQGFSLEPLYLANYLLIPFSLSLAYYIFAQKRYQLVLTTVFLTTILLTVARGAYGAVAAILIVSLLLQFFRKQYKQCGVLIAIVLISALATFGLIRLSGVLAARSISTTIVAPNAEPNLPDQTVSADGNSERLLHHVNSFGTDQSFGDRMRTIETALGAGVSHIFIGIGPGNFGRYVVARYPAQYGDTRQIVNNETAEIFAETGALGLIAILLFFAWAVRQAMYYSIKRNDRKTNIWFVATGLMLLGFVVQWQTFSTLYVTHIWVMVGIFIGVAQGAKYRGTSSKSVRLRHPFDKLRAGSELVSRSQDKKSTSKKTRSQIKPGMTREEEESVEK